jgi:hypothetical protein
MNGRDVPDDSAVEATMNSSETAHDAGLAATAAAACPLSSPSAARIPGLLALAAAPAAVLVNPFFFGLAGGLLAVISLLLSPARCRCLGLVGLISTAAGGILGTFINH